MRRCIVIGRMCCVLYLMESSIFPSMYDPWNFITPASTSDTFIESINGMPDIIKVCVCMCVLIGGC